MRTHVGEFLKILDFVHIREAIDIAKKCDEYEESKKAQANKRG